MELRLFNNQFILKTNSIHHVLDYLLQCKVFSRSRLDEVKKGAVGLCPSGVMTKACQRRFTNCVNA